jgi:hypothetical protein
MSTKVPFILWALENWEQFVKNAYIINPYYSVQTRTGIGSLGKPPAVKQFPTVENHLGVRALLRDPAQAQVWSEQVWLNTTFIS